MFGDSYTKVVAELIYLARHFGEENDGYLFLREQFTHQNLADLTGMVRETISLAMEKMVNQKLIHYQGNKIVIDDLDELRAQLERLV